MYLKLSIAFLFICKLGISQSDNKTNICKEVENTFQIINLQPRYSLAIPNEVCEVVKRERKKDVTFIYNVNEFYAIKIYSEKDIPNIKLPIELVIKAEQ